MRATWRLTALVLLLIAAGSYVLFAALRPEALPDQVIYANGRVEGTEVRMAAEIPGRISETPVREGERVAQGDVVVVLDATDIELQQAQAEAEVEALRLDRERLTRELELARHHLGTADEELARYRDLAERGTAPERALDEAEDAFAEAQARVSALEAAVAAAGAQIEAARRGLDLVARRREKATVRAPTDGTVVAKLVEPGEVVPAGAPVAVLVDLTKVEVRVFVPERETGRIGLGDPARVRVDAFPGSLFEGRVARVDQQAQFTPRDVHMPEERVRTVFGVTLALENPDGVLKSGMPADTWILWDAEAGWPERLVVPE